MVTVWIGWKKFPDAQHGESLQAPIGPGIYEVRNAATGEAIAFDYSDRVGGALCELIPSHAASLLRRLLRGNRIAPRSHDLEYRTIAASTKEDARRIAAQWSDRRHALLNRRVRLLSA